VKLLLVDDSKAIRLANQRALENVGYEVLCAEDGEAALKIAQSQPVDLVLLDLMLMPEQGVNMLPEELENIVCRLNRKRGVGFASVHTSH
jgi:two-component system response regulator VicR